jgi:serine/threonine protein kinase
MVAVYLTRPLAGPLAWRWVAFQTSEVDIGRIDRDVTIRVLPAALAQDPERLARFEREAKVLAALNRPNIAQTMGWSSSRW